MIPAPLLTLSAAALAAMVPAGDLLSAVYVCPGRPELPVVFVNPEGALSYAVAELDGRLVGLRQVVSGSGARYRSDATADGRVEYQLWIKGDLATLSIGPEGEQGTILADCRQSR